MDLTTFRLWLGGWLMFLAAWLLKDEPAADVLRSLTLDDIPDDPEAIAQVDEDDCTHPTDQRLDAQRMGAPRAWRCGVCGDEGGF